MRIIVAAADDASLITLAEMNGRIAEHILPAASLVASPAPTTSTRGVRLQQLCDAVQAVRACKQHRQKATRHFISIRLSPARPRSRRLLSPTASNHPAHDLCCHHRTYAEKTRLVYVGDRISGQRFLADTGAEISLLQSSVIYRRQKQRGLCLQVTNTSVIRTFELHFLTLNSGLRWNSRGASLLLS